MTTPLDDEVAFYAERLATTGAVERKEPSRLYKNCMEVVNQMQTSADLPWENLSEVI